MNKTRLYISRTVIMIIGIAINVSLSCFTRHFGLPLYLDTIGTIVVSAMTGSLWGLSTAVGTHIICSIFEPTSIYYLSVSVIVALISVSAIHNRKLKKKRYVVLFIFILSVVGGVLGTGIQWVLSSGPSLAEVAEISKSLAGGNDTLYGVFCILFSIAIDFVDKTIAVAVAFVLYKIVPKDFRVALWNSNWCQKPLSTEEVESLDKVSGGTYTLGGRIFALILATGCLLVTAQGLVTLKLYEDTVYDDCSTTVMKAAQFVAETMDGDRINEYLKSGMSTSSCKMKNYRESYDAIKRANKTMNRIKYMYVYQIKEDGVRMVLDVDPSTKNSIIGEKIEFDKAFLPYKKDLLAGVDIPVMESDDQFGHLLTAYVPIKTSSGRTVAYAGADIDYSSMENYTKEYLSKSFLIILGVLIFVVATGLWIARFFMVLPIKAIAQAMDGFAVEDVDQKTLDQKVKDFREIRVKTDDEIEYLYDNLCQMMISVAEQMRDLRHYTEATAQMQNGLIITMADMVESRDSDTGAHIQKTAAYVKIILEGLKKKGYYAEKLTPKYMSDAVISAPLHDVGKINVPDAVLNKPGKLTDEEYEIIKTHTTAGREIIERAIDTVHGENYLKEARNMAAYHHERWDGKGYPEGLHGEVIPLSARVMAVADVFDALTSKRVYKPAFPPEKALQIIEEGSGTQFDPKCVEAFMDSLTEVKIILKKYNQM